MEGTRPAFVVPILAAGLLSFAFSPILVRLAGEAPGGAVAVWRTVSAVVLLAPFALARAGPEIRAFTRREWGLIVAAGVFLGVHFIAWIESIYYTSVASASVLVTTSPIFLAILGYLFLGERLTRRQSGAVVLAVGGAALIGLGDAGGAGTASAPSLGNALALFAALVVSLYLLIGRVVRQRTSWLAYVFPLYAVVACTTVVAALVRGTPLFGHGWTFYGLCVLMALGPQLLGHGSFNYALRYLTAAVLGLLSLLEPVGAALLAYGLFGETPGPLALAGMGVVLAAVTAAVGRGSGRRGGPRTAAGPGESSP